MSILEQLKSDYHHFPADQTYDLYAEDVFFQDPLNQFRGVEQYRRMIGFIATYFQDVVMEVHDLQQQQNHIHSRWTLRWTAPFPWKPRMAISGRSELQVNSDGKICSHIDYWDCSRWAVFKQIFNPLLRPKR